jgi:hypothetical protein
MRFIAFAPHPDAVAGNLNRALASEMARHRSVRRPGRLLSWIGSFNHAKTVIIESKSYRMKDQIETP